MNNNTNKLPIWMGALVGALLTPPLMALLFLGERFAGLPFLPFDFFNWIARILPGPLVTFGIDRIVDLIIGLGLGDNLDAAAKTAEQTIGLFTFWILGVVAAALFFVLLERLDLKKLGSLGNNVGIVFGLIVGLPFLLISLAVNVSSTAPLLVQIIWVGLLYAGYGTAHTWVHATLMAAGTEKAKSSAEDEAPHAQRLDRRQFLVRLGGATATLTVVGSGLAALFNTTTRVSSGDSAVASNAGSTLDLSSGLQPAPGTRPEITPVPEHYRIDILSGSLPTIPDDYKLLIGGLVENPVEWTLDEIRQMPAVSEYITMGCISNRVGGSLISTVKWTGVPMQHIIDQIKPSEDTVALRIESVDGFDEYVSLDLIQEDERIMLAYAFDDQPLPLRNGFPLRIHIPNRFGMKQPKWITRIDAVDSHEDGYWVRRGWSATAIVKTTSVIDTVATENIFSDDSGQMFVPVGGIAWSGDRGISKVQVRIDGGEWVDTELRDPISDRTWYIWRYDWPFQEGTHIFEVRCFEGEINAQGDPTMQIEEMTGSRPDGATGFHGIRASIDPPSDETASTS